MLFPVSAIHLLKPLRHVAVFLCASLLAPATLRAAGEEGAFLVSADDQGAPAASDSGFFASADEWVYSPIFNDGSLMFFSQAFNSLGGVMDNGPDFDLFLSSSANSAADVDAVSVLSTESVVGVAAAGEFALAVREYGSGPYQRRLVYYSNTILSGWSSPSELIVDGYDWFLHLDASVHGDTATAVFAAASDSASIRDVFRQQFTYDLEDGFTPKGPPENLSEDISSDSFACSVSSDGRRIAFLKGASRSLLLWEEGTGQARLLSEGVRDPILSDDGRTLVFSRAGDRTLMICDIQSGTVSPVQEWKKDGFDIARRPLRGDRPALSHDGSTLVWRGREAGGIQSEKTQIFLLNRRTRQLACVSVTDSAALADANCFAPALSPGGTFASFASAAANLAGTTTPPAYQTYRASRPAIASPPYWPSYAVPSGNAPLWENNKMGLAPNGEWLAFSYLHNNATSLGLFNGVSGSFVESVFTAGSFASIDAAFTAGGSELYVLEGGDLHRILTAKPFQSLETLVADAGLQSFDLAATGDMVYSTQAGGVWQRRSDGRETLLTADGSTAVISARGNAVAFLRDAAVHSLFYSWDSSSGSHTLQPMGVTPALNSPTGLSLSANGRYLAVEEADGVLLLDLFGPQPREILFLEDAAYPSFADSGALLYVAAPPRAMEAQSVSEIVQGYLVQLPGGTAKVLTTDEAGNYGVAASAGGRIRHSGGTWHAAVSTAAPLRDGDMDSGARDIYSTQGTLPDAESPPWLNAASFRGSVAIAEDSELVFFPEYGDTDQRDQGRIRLTIVRQPAHGSLILAEGGLPPASYIPNPNFNGTDTFELESRDPQGLGSGPASFTVDVTPVDDQPVWTEDLTLQVDGDTETEIDLRTYVHDPDVHDAANPDQLSFDLLTSSDAVHLAADGYTLLIHATEGQDLSLQLSVSDDGFTSEAVPMPEGKALAVDVYLSRTMTLQQGWNLVSFPVDPSRASIETLFAHIAGPLWYWDPAAGYRPVNSDPQSPNYLARVGSGQGYWAFIRPSQTHPVEIDITGDVPKPLEPTDIAPGWQLAAPAGPLNERPVPLLPAGVSLLRWSPDSAQYQPLSPWGQDRMHAGKAYWFHNETAADVPVDLRLSSPPKD